MAVEFKHKCPYYDDECIRLETGQQYPECHTCSLWADYSGANRCSAQPWHACEPGGHPLCESLECDGEFRTNQCTGERIPVESHEQKRSIPIKRLSYTYEEVPIPSEWLQEYDDIRTLDHYRREDWESQCPWVT